MMDSGVSCTLCLLVFCVAHSPLGFSRAGKMLTFSLDHAPSLAHMGLYDGCNRSVDLLHSLTCCTSLPPARHGARAAPEAYLMGLKASHASPSAHSDIAAPAQVGPRAFEP